MKSKTTILYIFHISSIGGGSFCLLNMIKKMDRELYHPIVLLKAKGPLYFELEKLGASVFIEKWISTVPYNKSLFVKSSIIQVFSILISLRKVKSWIKKSKADILHLNTMMMYPYSIPARQLGKKVIIHIREHWPTGEHQIQFRIAQNIIRRNSDRIIAINETSARMIGAAQKTQVIYDWIDFENRNDEIDFNKLFGEDFKSLKIFLFLGGTSWIKGTQEVLEVFINHISSKEARLLLVGCDNKIVSYYGFKGFLKKVLSFFNYYRYNDKVKLIAQKDNRIVFLPLTYQVKSLIEQSFCVVSFFTIPHANLPIAEATWLGKPSIAANTPEALEYSNNGKAALLFKMNDKQEFKNKIYFALENEQLVSKNAIDSIVFVQEKFDPVRNSILLNDIYKDLSTK